MKRLLLSFFLIINGLAALSAQCTVDSAAVGGLYPVYPPPYLDTVPGSGIPDSACIGQPFEFTITFAVPDTILNPALPFPIAINSVKIEATGAILNLPSWATYTCGPTAGVCLWPKNTLGCVRIFGTPPPGATVGSVDLTINVVVNTVLIGPYPLSLPGGTLNIPGKYTLVTLAANDPKCTVGTDELAGVISKIVTSPNPFAAQTTLKIDAFSTEVVDFQVVNLLGQSVENRSVKLFPGENQVDFDASNLPAGIYQYSIGNEKGQRTGKLVVAR